MTIKKSTITSDGIEIKESYCRKCMKILPVSSFYQSVDGGMVDSNNLLSVCKDCCQILYDDEFHKTGSMEKSIHKLCQRLNIKFSQEAIESTKIHLETQTGNGVNSSSPFSTYKSKLISGKRSMNKALPESMEYEDVAVIYIEKPVSDPNEIPVPSELKRIWGDNYKFKEIQYLESQYAEFKKTHKVDSQAGITLLREVCHKLMDIKRAREADPPESTEKDVKQLQELLKNLAISPYVVSANAGDDKASRRIGTAIEDIERYEPIEWLKKDGKKYSMLRDVDNIEEYYQNYFVRPLKNSITGSRDFNLISDKNTDLDDVDADAIMNDTEDDNA